MFDLTRKSTLTSVKDWYRQAREHNKACFDWWNVAKYLTDIHRNSFHFLLARNSINSKSLMSLNRLRSQIWYLSHFKCALFLIIPKARRYAAAMKSPTIFCSAQASLNVDEIFKIILCKAFKLKCTIPPVTQAGEAIIEYENPAPAAGPSGAPAPK